MHNPALLAVSLLLTLPALAAEPVPVPKPVLHVTGMARAAAPADRIDIHVYTVGDGQSPESAAKDSGKAFAALTAAAAEHGVDVQLAAVSLTAQEEPDRTTGRSVTRHKLTKHYVMTLRSLEKLDALLAGVAKTGARVSQLELLSEKLQGMNDQLVADAVENAKKRAEQAATAAGQKLGRLVSVTPRSGGAQTAATFVSAGGGAARGSGTVGATFYVDVVYELT